MVKVGVDSIKKSKKDKSVQELKVLKHYPHPKFEQAKKGSDLQLLKVS